MSQHQIPSQRRATVATVAAIFLALSGCGGGDDDSSSGTTSTATVTAPSITTQPTSTSVNSGSSVTLSVTASGGGTLSYQWYKDGSAVSGATSASYTIGAASASNAGSYYVVVTNSAGSATSSTVTLTVVTGGGSSGSGESWNLTTGANSADLVENVSFDFTVNIDLATQAITTSSARLLVGTTASSVTPITLDGTTVITVTADTYGLTVRSTVPDDIRIEYALSGNYAGSLTLLGDTPAKLTLNGATIASPNGPAINLQSGERTFVELSDGTTNVLSDTSSYSTRYLDDGDTMDLKAALFAEGALIFSGGGSLSVTSAAKHAIASDDHVRIRDGNITLYSNAKDGIRTNDAFVLDGGDVRIETANGAGKGIKVEGKEDDTTPLGFIAINDGTLDILSYDKAITASWEGDEDGDTTTTADDPDPRVTINGGTITVSTFGTPYEDRNTADGDDSLSPEGIESKSVLTINGGTLSITTTDDALNAGTGIVINGGYIYARASANDAVDSNGTMTITGGVLVAVGANGAEGGLDCDSNTFKVTGGTFVGFGGRNSSPTRSVTTQNTVSLRSSTANTLLTIKDSSGAIAFSVLAPTTATAILLSSPQLTTGTAYTVYSGGSIGSSTEQFNGLYLGASGHSGGTAGSTFTISSTVTSL
ncbi:carbohydrate-binding domain-containing protein [Steroidobacter sp.]|uniref:carbohydrate-binding domain-containing protein n=1 Tax=Steroidobacter sp. TaxID=1978227 RepID=UPI001A487B83|nr:carbohydrate-binding domain-containing protein [Steroidobacter sp.]MBL8269811.1 carbohydrate-binding domain-containing protein [Steroidobacter sp.]